MKLARTKTSTVHSPQATASLSFSSTTIIVVVVLCCVVVLCETHMAWHISGRTREGHQGLWSSWPRWGSRRFSLHCCPDDLGHFHEPLWGRPGSEGNQFGQFRRTPFWGVIKPEKVRVCVYVSECASAHVCNEHALVLKEPCISNGLLPSSSGTGWGWNVLGILRVFCHKWCSECGPKREGIDQDLHPE